MKRLLLAGLATAALAVPAMAIFVLPDVNQSRAVHWPSDPPKLGPAEKRQQPEPAEPILLPARSDKLDERNQWRELRYLPSGPPKEWEAEGRANLWKYLGPELMPGSDKLLHIDRDRLFFEISYREDIDESRMVGRCLVTGNNVVGWPTTLPVRIEYMMKGKAKPGMTWTHRATETSGTWFRDPAAIEKLAADDYHAFEAFRAKKEGREK